MIVGFTGVIWEARTAERLAHDLHDGRGPVQLAESGLAWGTVAAEIAEVGVEYGKILAGLGVHWDSPTYNHAFEKLTQLVPWFADAAGHAVQTAARAEQQAAATTVALTAMPNPIEIQATKDVSEALSKVHIAAGSPLVAAAANTERAQQDQMQRASRVMESYERATTPVSTPWKHAAPPKIVSPAALRAEEAAAKEAAEKAAAKPGGSTGASAGMVPMTGLGGFGGAVAPREKSKYATTGLAGVSQQPSVVSNGVVEPTRPSTTIPMAPAAGAAGAAAGAHGDDEAPRRRTEPTASGASASDVNLPAGWVEAGQQDSEVTWADVAGRYGSTPGEPAMLAGEGVLNLDADRVVPAVLGAPDRDGGS
ncbi:PPE domain-containing protein [Gordonia soli]|uniref:PPE domain-containing protein n=1 Tax=Gordonia soli NBRC 108243 TaxID=1223545 RepID=M0QLA6_9ACTN|nr:PPE domain-containing protein [Gordonia soli]GAC69338.1 hypothetical protein GS4_23_01350 [Gordonia soli NBRC 108243]